MRAAAAANASAVAGGSLRGAGPRPRPARRMLAPLPARPRGAGATVAAPGTGPGTSRRHRPGRLGPVRVQSERQPQQELKEERKVEQRKSTPPQQQKPRQGNQGDSWDPVLVAGDAVMLMATELSSERIPIYDQGFLCLSICTWWTMVAFLRGDYKHSNLDVDAFQAWFMVAPMLASMQSALYTWVLFAPTVAALLAYMTSHGMLDPAIVQPVDGDSPAIAEVLIAVVLTMTSWRGIYAGLFL